MRDDIKMKEGEVYYVDEVPYRPIPDGLYNIWPCGDVTFEYVSDLLHDEEDIKPA